MSADKKLKAYIDRVLRLKEEQDTIGDDIREVYAEAKGEGYDKTVMGKLVAHLRKVAKSGADAVDEAESIFETYLSAYHRASGTPVATHTHEEDFDPITGEFVDDEDANPRLIKQVVDGTQTEAGRAALLTVINIMTDREEAEAITSSGGSPSAPSSLTTREAEESVVPHSPETATEQRVNVHSQHEGANAQATVQNECVTVVGTESGTVAISEKATVATQGEATEPTSDERETDLDEAVERDRAAANTGGTDVESSAPRAGLADPTSNTGEGAANTALPADGIVMEYVPPTGMKRLPFASCFPDHSKAEYERLEKDIAASRVRQPIIRQGNVIIDGFARYAIARKYGFAYPVQEYTGNDLLLDLIEWQRAARNFTPAQEKKIAAELAKESPHRADDIMAAFGLAEALEDVA
ncbi:GapR family DNA-binding domain-containing protein [Shinella sp. CPCC 101442]|uniref:GapR family DNA-binding domain-containing protein n=1 Tax=Shinella sp. CPCC 101442 TaxID=2932265 RepID=UPI0035B56B4B